MENREHYTFPDNFTWGTATASFQVEGGAHEGGRTDSIWDTYCAVPGNILDSSNGDVACDEYHRYGQDIDLMKELGVGAYRFSVAWPRIVPQADGKINQQGVDYYKKVLDDLRDAGIKPVVTLYHWDLPQYLQNAGGWANRDIAMRYGDYVSSLAHALGDRVEVWTTLNEPWCTAYLGYGNGCHAPGISDYAQALETVHHLNLAHGLGVQAVRAELGESAQVSVTLNLQVTRAASSAAEDLAAKERADLIANEVFLGPMLEGRYDERIIKATSGITDWSFNRSGDMEIIQQPLNVLGVNYYSTVYVRACDPQPEIAPGPSGRPTPGRNPMPAQERVESLAPTGELTDMGWNQEPEGLRDLLLELSERFPGLPLMVTENGSAWQDNVSTDSSSLNFTNGKIVHDPKRVAYMDVHLKALADAIESGANVVGYFAWSLLDNFEWSLGYSKRFGIIRVDYETQERIWKDSGLHFREIVRANAF
ncbi:GH1 family beta-glucosidase [Bombiscardovia coagulans]|uniref:Beta-glucosidase n=1 Tax=Bombiscardovia coagulans TaxID=686666 RepID=A0A261EUU3_9BIFI|nr:GH1 family beta-glucosidase [Bombiscardovia coagulans]OZG50416.1 beta-glucosidase [Bombiscardovia coagulans]